MADCCEEKACAIAALQERQSSTLKLVLAINAVMFVVELAARVLQSAVAELKRSAAAAAKVEFVKLQRR